MCDSSSVLAYSCFHHVSCVISIILKANTPKIKSAVTGCYSFNVLLYLVPSTTFRLLSIFIALPQGSFLLSSGWPALIRYRCEWGKDRASRKHSDRGKKPTLVTSSEVEAPGGSRDAQCLRGARECSAHEQFHLPQQPPFSVSLPGGERTQAPPVCSAPRRAGPGTCAGRELRPSPCRCVGGFGAGARPGAGGSRSPRPRWVGDPGSRRPPPPLWAPDWPPRRTGEEARQGAWRGGWLSAVRFLPRSLVSRPAWKGRLEEAWGAGLIAGRTRARTAVCDVDAKPVTSALARGRRRLLETWVVKPEGPGLKASARR